TDRWIVTAALYVVGAGYLATAVGMSFLTVAARVGLTVAGVAAIGIASFPVPVQGTSRVHSACTAIGAVTIAAWPVLADRQDSVRQAIGRRASIAAMLISATLLLWAVRETHNGTALGLAERTSSAAQVCWPFVVALALRRRAAASPTREPARSDARSCAGSPERWRGATRS